MMTSPKQPPLQCLECKKSFSHLSNIKRHLKTHQANREGGTDDEKQDRSIKCILCNNTNLLKSNLLVHLEEHHNIKIERKDLHFSNELEFQKWKSDWEKKNHPSYVTYSHPCTTMAGIKNSLTFAIVLAFIYQALKNTSKKINGICSSKIKVCVLVNGTVKVTSYKLMLDTVMP
nr:unnamed protein product [Callosobruchus analis]